MLHKSELGTDIAMIGVWNDDAAPEDLRRLKYKDLLARLTVLSQAGDLLYVNTGGDGSYTTWITDNARELNLALDRDYRKVPGPFHLLSPSGTFKAGGLEDYKNPRPQITSDRDRFQLPPGSYTVDVHVLRLGEEEAAAEVRKATSEEEWARYERKPNGCVATLILLLAGLLGAAMWSRWLIVPALILGFLPMLAASRRNRRDPVVARIQGMLEEWDQRHPYLVMVMTKADPAAPSRGCFHLDEVGE